MSCVSCWPCTRQLREMVLRPVSCQDAGAAVADARNQEEKGGHQDAQRPGGGERVQRGVRPHVHRIRAGGPGSLRYRPNRSTFAARACGMTRTVLIASSAARAAVTTTRKMTSPVVMTHSRDEQEPSRHQPRRRSRWYLVCHDLTRRTVRQQRQDGVRTGQPGRKSCWPAGAETSMAPGISGSA